MSAFADAIWAWMSSPTVVGVVSITAIAISLFTISVVLGRSNR